MRAITGILLTGFMALLVCQPSRAEEEFSADYLASAIVEAFHANGLTVGSYGKASMDGDALVIDGLRAYDGEGGIGFSAEKVRISGIKEEDKGPEPWLGMAKVSATGVDMAVGGLSFRMSGLQAEGLEFQNSNTAEDKKRYGYKYIDGPFSAMKLSSFSASDSYVLLDGKSVAHVGAASAEANGWFSEFTVPSVAAFSISGTVYPEAAAVLPGLPTSKADFVADGKFVIDSVTGLATANLSASSSGYGEALVKATLSGVKRGLLTRASSWAAGKEGARQEVLDGIRLSRLAVAARGIGWTSPFLVPVMNAAKNLLSPEAAGAAVAALEALPAKDGRAVVVEMTPPGTLPLSNLASGGSAGAGSLGFQVR
jgi:hypothetical protein